MEFSASSSQEALQKFGNFYTTQLTSERNEFNKEVRRFLLQRHKRYLIVHSKDTKEKATSLKLYLDKIGSDVKVNYGNGNKVMVHIQQLVMLTGKSGLMPKLPNLLVVEYPFNEEELPLFSQILGRIYMTQMKKLIVVTNSPQLDRHFERFSIIHKPSVKIGTNKPNNLYKAVELNLLHNVEELIENGADVNQVYSIGVVNKSTALHVAAREGHTQVLVKLLHSGATFKRDLFNMTPLHVAAGACHTECVTALVENGADINDRDMVNDTPLHLACDQQLKTIAGLPRHNDVVKCLISYDADINAKNGCGWTPLHYAVRCSALSVVKTLLKHNAEVNCVTQGADEVGDTPLHFAVQNGYYDIVETLLKKGADVNRKNKMNESPLDMAKGIPHYGHIVKLLEKHGYLQMRSDVDVYIKGVAK